jgi:hypothetical protein
MTKVLQSSRFSVLVIAGVTNRTMVILGSPHGFAAAPVYVVRRYILVVWLYTSSKFCKSCGKIGATCMLGSQETPCFSVSWETAVGMHLTPRGSQRDREKERESCIRNCSTPGAHRIVEAGLARGGGGGEFI